MRGHRQKWEDTLDTSEKTQTEVRGHIRERTQQIKVRGHISQKWEDISDRSESTHYTDVKGHMRQTWKDILKKKVRGHTWQKMSILGRSEEGITRNKNQAQIRRVHKEQVRGQGQHKWGSHIWDKYDGHIMQKWIIIDRSKKVNKNAIQNIQKKICLV